jgi:hypothetical protein
MSSTYSTSLRAELIGSGDQAGAWGSTTNSNFSNIFDVAIAGYQTVSVTSASQALTYLNGPTTTAALNQSVYAMLRFTTTTGAAFNVYAPPVSKHYIVYNNSGYSMIVYNSTVIGNTTAAGTGVTVSNGSKVMIWSDGTNFYELQASNLTGTLAIANGGTGQTTANAAFNALAPSQTSANGKYLKSDGTNTSWDQVDISTSDITGTLAIANGGTGVTTITALGNLFYPVGSIYTSTVSTNPGTSLGFGTWTAFGAGRVLIGNGGGFSAGATGGSADAVVVSHTHTGTTATNGSHQHAPVSAGLFLVGSLAAGVNGWAGGGNFEKTTSNSLTGAAGTHDHTFTTASSGSSGTNANLQPYVVVYMWQRTA